MSLMETSMMRPNFSLSRTLARRFAVILPLATMLAGCISLGGAEPPEQLLNLTPRASITAGVASEGAVSEALAVQVPTVPQRLNVNRVPVTTSDSTLAYLAGAFWVEKPAQLFRNVLAATIRSKGQHLVVDGGELAYAARKQLTGQLVEMGYDATTSQAVIIYDAVLVLPDGQIRTQRFEERVGDVLPEADAVGAALNDAANVVAGEVADWVG